MGRIRPAKDDVAGAVRGEADAGAVDAVAEAVGVVGPADGVAEAADGEAGEGFRSGDAGGLVLWESATAVAGARPASSSRSGCIVMTRQTRRPVTTSPVVVPTSSPRLRLRCRAARRVSCMFIRSEERVGVALLSGRKRRKSCRRCPVGSGSGMNGQVGALGGIVVPSARSVFRDGRDGREHGGDGHVLRGERQGRTPQCADLGDRVPGTHREWSIDGRDRRAQDAGGRTGDFGGHRARPVVPAAYGGGSRRR
ncbi:hypothetical protein GCM10010303_29200 [Streptomyces purpurascens]|nr:hypothetical protein GCM10010303_29200 [Streptomyces purpurascens]